MSHWPIRSGGNTNKQNKPVLCACWKRSRARPRRNTIMQRPKARHLHHPSPAVGLLTIAA